MHTESDQKLEAGKAWERVGVGLGRGFISGLFQKQCGGGYRLQYAYFSNFAAKTMLLGLGFLLGTLALEQVMDTHRHGLLGI